MKSIFYKNCIIEEFKHPKLIGKYSIYYNDCELFFRAYTIKEAKKIINNQLKTKVMKAASLIHIEIGIEYYKDGSLLNPSRNEKLMWSIYGLPKGIEKIEKIFETEIDEFIGFNEKEIKYRLSENIKNGLYNYLPSDACLELRVRSSQNIECK